MPSSSRIIQMLAAALLLPLAPSLALSQEGTRWQLSWFDTLTNKNDSTVFSSREDAVAHQKTYEKVQNLKKGGPAYTNWKLTPLGKSQPASNTQAGGTGATDLLSRLREAKAAAAAAVRSGNEALRAKELLLREVIDEYKDTVARSYQKVRDLEKTLVGGTQDMQDKRFREINQLVDQYNRQVSDFQSVMGPTVTLGFRPVPRFQPVAAKADDPEKPSSGDMPVPAEPRQTFKLYVWQNSSGDMFRATFDSLEAARAAGEQHMSQRGQKGYRITDGRSDSTTKNGASIPPNAKILAKRDRY